MHSIINVRILIGEDKNILDMDGGDSCKTV
jgi:hypothetical protein